MFSYGACLLLSWAYLVLACTFAATGLAGRQAPALAGAAFAVLYSGFATTVYFVQLTTVLHGSASPDILRVLDYTEPGSLMFNLELLGYGLMALSTLFVGLSLTVVTRADWWLKLLLIVHGVFAPFCVALPIINTFGSMPGTTGGGIVMPMLIAWCIYFAATAALAFRHFSNDRAIGRVK